MSDHADMFCPSCGHADWPHNCPTACVVGSRFHALVAERDEAMLTLQASRNAHDMSVAASRGLLARAEAAESERDEALRQAATWKSGNENAMRLSDAYLDRAEAAEARNTELVADLVDTERARNGFLADALAYHDRAEAAEACVTQLEAALTPFADIKPVPSMADTTAITVSNRAIDRARAALSPKEEGT